MVQDNTEGKIIKAGDIPPNALTDSGEHYWPFETPFPNKCLGVVITQKLKLHDVAWNNAVTQFDKNGFTVFCGTSENRAGFSYIAFGY